MQNIYEILKIAGLEIPEDKKAGFDKAVVENYKTIAEVEKINDKHVKEIDPLQQKLIAYETQLVKFKDVDVDSLKEEITKLQGEITGINETQAREKSDAETNGIINSFYGTLQGKDFVNDFTKDSITSKIKAALADPTNKGKGISELFDGFTKDVDGVFKNPHPQVDIKGAGSVKTTITKEDWGKLTYMEKYKVKTEQPELYNLITKGE